MSSIIPNGKSREYTPQLNDLLTNIVEQYAVKWKKLGLNLGLKNYQLANIEENTASRQSRQVETCCRMVLEKWLELDPLPTWGKLDDVIISFNSTPVMQSTGHYYKACDNLKEHYKSTRFNTEKDCWPPEQPKFFTPVVLICKKGKRSKRETEVMVEAFGKGGIEKYLSTTTRKITSDLQEVFCLLEQLSDSQHQRSILVEGSPGIGKSVLLKQIAYLWANGELLTDIHFLFLLHLRDPSVQQILCLQSLVNYFYQEYDEQACSDLIPCICQDSGKSVTILLDGYDELPQNLRQNNFIVDLLEHKILPACTIVVSSRPHASTDLHDNISYQIEILGFSEQHQKHFIEHSLKDQHDEIMECKQYLKNYSAISNLCFIPFNMTILLFLYKSKEEILLPTNPTSLYKLFICLTICRHLARSGITLDKEIKDLNCLPQQYKKTINQLSKFAFKALGNNQLVFSLAEIKKECPDIDKTINGFGLLQAVRYIRITSTSLFFSFIHRSIQEFLAAHYITTLSTNKELYILENYFWDSSVYFNMFDIYVELTNGQTTTFKQFLRLSLIEKFKNLFTGKRESVGISEHLLRDKMKCLRLYYCFQKAGDMKMCKSIEEATKVDKQEIQLSCTRLSPSDLEYLTTFLTCSSCKEWKLVDFCGCYIQDHGLQILQNGLRSSNLNIKWLRLFYNDLTEVSSSAISDITIRCKVKILNVTANYTVGENDELYRILTDDSSMVEELWMTHIMLSSSGAIKLFTALSKAEKLRILDISHNDINDEACDTIIMAMKKNTSLATLYIDNNPISGEYTVFIIQALQHESTMTLQRLSINEITIMKLKEKIILFQEEINMKRKACGCQILHIEFQ